MFAPHPKRGTRRRWDNDKHRIPFARVCNTGTTSLDQGTECTRAIKMMGSWFNLFDAQAWSLTTQSTESPLMHRHVHGATIPTNEQKTPKWQRKPIMNFLKHRMEPLHSPLGAKISLLMRDTSETPNGTATTPPLEHYN